MSEGMRDRSEDGPPPRASPGVSALAALRAVNAHVLRAGDEAELLAAACRAIAEAGGYAYAWISYLDPTSGTLRMVASCNMPEARIEELGPMRLDDGWSAHLAAAVAADEAYVAGCDFSDVGRAAEGCAALAVLPLRGEPDVAGALFACSGEAQAFAGEALALLHEAARSLAHGIGSLRTAAGRARAERDLQRVERARRTLSAVNRTLVRATDEQALLDDICRIIVEVGGYRHAWVGYARDDEAKSVQAVAHAGVDEAYLAGLDITWSDGERGRGATGAAIRSGEPSIGRDLARDPDSAPWREAAMSRGCAAVSAFPLRVGGAVIGNLSLAAAEPDAFDAAEAELLGELAEDLAFGIETLRVRAKSRESEQALRRLAEWDALTGLPNRGRLQVRLAAEIEAARARHRPLALLILGLDRFQEINETLGYQQGDGMLREVARRIGEVVAEPAELARVGEAEFAILLPDSDAGAARRIGRRLLAKLFAPVAMGDIMLDIGGSIGIALYPGHAGEPDLLVRRANVAMNQARQQGRGLALYTGGRDRECARRMGLIGDLHRAIERSELRLYCQPKLRFATRAVCGVEALLRWEHPQLGMISPNEFIALAEHSGLINPLTDWVMQTAFRQSYVWREAGLAVPVAVNLSARDLRDPKLVERVHNLFATWGAAPEDMQFELTESALMQDPQGSLASLRQLKELGSTLFIDDFGTGYSSLAYLQQLPVDAIKIDQSFVRDMLSNPDSAVIVRSTIDLAHDLDLEVVAEGVESQAGWERLAAQGCDVAQGYVVSEPLPAEAFGAWQAARAAQAAAPAR